MSETSTQPRPWRCRMTGRDPEEPHRTQTPLELLFDLTFVVAVAFAASQLHHSLSEGHIGSALLGYAVVFFGTWWAWMNFTWFASAYDTDDVPYRLVTLVQMGGVLVFAAGIPAAFNQFDLTTIVIGYVIMRVAMIAQWLRAGYADRGHRPTTVRYAAGVAAVQAGWVAYLWIPGLWGWISFVLLVLAELAVPLWAESSGPTTPWHLGHITKRYGSFIIIMFGEVIAAVTTAVHSALSAGGPSLSLLSVAVGGLLLVFGLWWGYFKHSTSEEIQLSLSSTLIWGYGHYVVFASVAALGAGLQVVVDVFGGTTDVTPMFAAFTVAIPVTVFLVASSLLNSRMSRQPVATRLVLLTALLVLLTGLAAPLISLPVSILVMALLVALLLSYHLTLGDPDR